MDIVYRKSTGQILTVADSSGAKWNLSEDEALLVTDLGEMPHEAVVSTFCVDIKTEKLKRKDRLALADVLPSLAKEGVLVIQKQNYERQNLNVGSEEIGVFINQHIETGREEVTGDPIYEIVETKRKLNFKDGRIELAYELDPRIKSGDTVEIKLEHPLMIGKSTIKEVK